jgi:hypothetical protein
MPPHDGDSLTLSQTLLQMGLTLSAETPAAQPDRTGSILNCDPASVPLFLCCERHTS